MSGTWASHSRRNTRCQAGVLDQFTCTYDSDAIPEGTVIVRIKGDGPTIDYHPECWLETVVDLLRQVPYETVKRGRRKLDLDDDQATLRRKLQGRYAAFKRRIEDYKLRVMDNDPNSDQLRISIQTMELRQDQIWWQIQELGGAPEKWRIPKGARKDSGEVRTSLDAGVS